MKSGALAGHEVYQVGNVVIDPSRNCVERNSAVFPLRNKTFRTLLYLIEHRQRLVSKDELFREIWAGAAVTDGALVQCIREIRQALEDDAQRPRIIKTVARVGYQFVAPVEARADQATLPPLPLIPSGAPAMNWRYGAAALTLLGFVSVSLYVIGSRTAISAVPSPGKAPVVAVMPFTNQSGDASLTWLEDGLPDMLTSGLARSPDLAVLSVRATDEQRRSAAALVVTGGFAMVDGVVRVDAQVVDGATQQVVGAESLTVPLSELLRQIDVLALRIGSALGAPPRDDRPLVRSAMTDDVEAYRAYSLAVARAHAFDTGRALELLEEAIARDPRFAMAHARIGYVYTLVRVNERHKAIPYLEKAFSMTDRLSEKDRLLVEAWYALARDRDAEAVPAFRAVVERYPLETEASWRLGQLLGYLGRFDEALAALERGVATDPGAAVMWNAIGFGYMNAGRYERAVAAHRRYVALEPDEANAHDSLGVTLAQAGQLDEALTVLDRALALRPDFHFAVLHKGDVLFQLGRLRDATVQYRRYFQLAPSNWDRAMAINRLALTQSVQGDLRGAIQTARREMEFGVDFGTELRLALVSGDTAGVAALEARYFGDRGDPPRGGKISNRDADYLRGMTALKRGDGDAAIAAFKKALAFPHLLWGINSLEDALAEAYRQLGQHHLAIAEYQRLLRINQSEVPLHFGIAKSYAAAGQPAEARSHYARIVQLWRGADADVPMLVEARRLSR